jgi:type IV secretion system protein VirD4
MGAYPGLSRILLGSILYYVYQNRPKHQVLFLIDEMPRLGYMRLLEEARDVGRGLGIKLWVIVQELGQLRKLYGQDGISAWLENTGIQQFFGIKGLETAKRLVETLGETMVDISSVSLNQHEASKESRSVSTQKQKRSLITVDEILQLGSENQIILSEHNKPLKCAKSPYYRQKEFMRLLK